MDEDSDRILKIFFSNVQGCSAAGKIQSLRARTSEADFLVLNELNKKPGDESVLSPLKMQMSVISNTPAEVGGRQRGLGPGFGTFFGSRQWKPNNGDVFWRHDSLELGVMTRKLEEGMTVSVIGMYRSPSMSIDEMKFFYHELSKALRTRIRARDDIIILCGDDNAHTDGTSNKARKAFSLLEGVRRKFGGVHVVTKPTRGKYQPDHVIAFTDPMRYNVFPCDPIKGVADHKEMHIRVSLGHVAVPQRRWFDQNIVVDEGNPDKISKMLTENLSDINKELFSDKFHWCQQDLDYIVGLFNARVRYVRLANRVTKRVRLPCYPGVSVSKEEKAVQTVLNKISQTSVRLKEQPDNLGLKEKLQDLKSEYARKTSIATRAALEKDMSKMKRNSRVDVSRFFAQTKRYLKFEGIDQVLSESELQSKLTAAEENYYLQGPEFTLDDINDVEPLNYFEINEDVNNVVEIIKRLNKIDSFYKRYAVELAPSLALILMIMNRSHLFPSVCKITNLTFLPNRTIFSLDFLAKFVERAVQDAIDEVTPPEEYGQFAYQKFRSCELLVAIGLDRAERCPVPCIGVGMDARKAFDTAPWRQMGINMQQTCNGGLFRYNYTKNRTHKFQIGFP